MAGENTDEVDTGKDESIASLLADAVTQTEKAAEPEPAKEAKEAKAEKEPKESAGEAKEEPEPKAGEDGGKEEKEPSEPAGKDEKAAKEQPDKSASATEPPAHWAKRDKEMFARVADPQVQSWLLERNKAMEADYTKKTMAAAGLRKEYEPVDALFAPHRDAMKQKGYTPHSLIQAWMNVEQRLAAGPESAVSVLQGLVNGYKIPVDKVAQALGLSAAQARQAAEQGAEPGTGAQPEAIKLPPELEQKLNALGQIQARLDREDRDKIDQARRQAQAAEAEQEKRIQDFKGETDGKGNLLHPHFEEVEQDMLNLALGLRASNKPIPPLSDLYERAVHANPATRAKVLAVARQQEIEAQREADRKKAAAAKRAGSSVTGSPSGNGQAPNAGRGAEKSLREQLEEAYEDVA